MYRCLFYEFITRQTLIQLKEGECEFDVLMKLFRVLGYPGVELIKLYECRMIVPSSRILLISHPLQTASNITVNFER